MRGTPSLLLRPDTLWPGVVAPGRVLSMSQTELNCVIMLNWITWNRTVLVFKQRTYVKLNSLKWNCYGLINWIVWNGTVFDIETVLTVNLIAWNRTVFDFLTVCKRITVLRNIFVWNKGIYIYKIDLVLITNNGWCAIKLNQTKSSLSLCPSVWHEDVLYFVHDFLSNRIQVL